MDSDELDESFAELSETLSKATKLPTNRDTVDEFLRHVDQARATIREVLDAGVDENSLRFINRFVTTCRREWNPQVAAILTETVPDFETFDIAKWWLGYYSQILRDPRLERANGLADCLRQVDRPLEQAAEKGRYFETLPTTSARRKSRPLTPFNPANAI